MPAVPNLTKKLLNRLDNNRFKVVKYKDRITSYNVCYTKLLRVEETEKDEVTEAVAPKEVDDKSKKTKKGKQPIGFAG